MLVTNTRIYVAGHRGLVGSALVRSLRAAGSNEILKCPREELDLRNQSDTFRFFEKARPEVVCIAAARVGGILANSRYPVEFLYDNLTIEMNIIRAAAETGTRRLLFLGSGCIYPRETAQPMTETSLLTGSFEPTNEAYAIAKIAGLKLCEYYSKQYGKDFFTAIPTGLYGPGDNFDPEQSHVIPALLRKFHQAKKEDAKFVELWGSGAPVREFLFVEDAAEALHFLLRNGAEFPLINIAGGESFTIEELSNKVAEITGYRGEIRWDRSKPDGMPKKALDGTRLTRSGWRPKVSLNDGLEKTYRWAIDQGVFDR